MSEARVTPCQHYFHGVCLKKWLFVKQSCPMCHKDLNLTRRSRRNRRQGTNDEEGYSSDSSETSIRHRVQRNDSDNATSFQGALEADLDLFGVDNAGSH